MLQPSVYNLKSPSLEQLRALERLEKFLASDTQVFQLKGYAGSGKTTLIKGLVSYLQALERPVKLMAPTGRAAKVLRDRTGYDAFTIHKTIYSYDDLVEAKEGDSFVYYYKLASATETNMVFIVDEASMIADVEAQGEFFRFGTGHLLTDLITYSRVHFAQTKNKIIFVGDPCQLAPVNDSDSFAFDKEYLKRKFDITVEDVEMKEVRRQVSTSGILNAASKIRVSITSGYFNDFDLRDNQEDVRNLHYEDLLATWENTTDTKVVVAYKNETCRQLNNAIRNRIWGAKDLPVRKGDIVIVGGNSYSKGIFNGEFAVVNEANTEAESRVITLKGKAPVTLSWRNVELVFPDADEENKVVKGKIIENFLLGDNLLKPDEMQALFVDFKNRHPQLKPGTTEFKQAILQDEYFNCIKLKFGYAVTCHKAQGGEWATVFSVWDYGNNNSHDFFKDALTAKGRTNSNFFRWAYTAITRASKRLYAINPPRFNSYTNMSFVDEEVLTALGTLTGQPVQPVEIELNAEHLQELSNLGLSDQPIPVQDHFLTVRETVRSRYFEVTGWERKGYEILYTFRREGKQVKVKTWIGKDNLFNGKFMHQPTPGEVGDLYPEVEPLLKLLPKTTVKRSTSETILRKVDFNVEQEERYPFIRLLLEDLKSRLESKGVVIEKIDHHLYRERYTIVRGNETAVIDFEYNEMGFWGRVLPLSKKCNSVGLIREIREAIFHLKSDGHVS